MAKKRELKKYKTYMFKEFDPAIGEVLQVIGATKFGVVAGDAGMSSSTLRNWKNKKTRRPQHATLAAAAGAKGYQFKLVRGN